VGAGDSALFDLAAYLKSLGYEELAGLPVEARIQGVKLILGCIVNFDADRALLIELAEDVPGVSQVSAVNLLLRPLPTYTVEEGDTLWSIAYKIYGNFERVQDIYRYNTDILTSQDALSVGMALRLPPLE
jgi:phage tail protein X